MCLYLAIAGRVSSVVGESTLRKNLPRGKSRNLRVTAECSQDFKNADKCEISLYYKNDTAYRIFSAIVIFL
jgi:hypothetical protein